MLEQNVVIKSVSIEEYYSDIPQEIIVKALKNKRCNEPGLIELILKPQKQFTQKGPYILPPIRWLDSFEENAEFHIKCEASK
nr:putative maintenance protein [Saccharomycopsis fibuligera]WOF72336.1 putative maintenance protein [Saccharomycopsis fibuligera]WOF72350.1 putative maintenance protein [Saccharomycopsis fibuligera]